MNNEVDSVAAQDLSMRPPPYSTLPTRQKRRRLPLACNQCRERKVRCDTELPQCQNCRRRGDLCETTDPRRPDAAAHRQRPRGETRHMREQQRHRRLQEQEKHPYRDAALEKQAVYVAETSATAALFSTADFDESPARRNAFPVTPQQSLDPVDQEPALMSNEVDQFLPRQIELAKDDDSPSMMVITAEGQTRRKYMGGSSLHCLCAFVDVYLCRKALPPISSKFHYGMKHADEFGLPLTPNLPTLPPSETFNRAMESFSSRILPLYPVIDPANLLSEVKRLRDLQDNHSHSSFWTGGLHTVIRADDIPMLCTIYCVTTIGMDEQDTQLTNDGNSYLTAAYGLLGHLNAMPYLASVQALFLLSTALRGRGREGQAWHILGQAIRIAHSIGLHKHLPHRGKGGSMSDNSQPDLSSCIWWSCYALEKQMELEMGRPSSIRDLDNDRVPPQRKQSLVPDEASDFHAIWVSLASILGDISEHIFRRGSENSATLLYETGKLDQALQIWADTLPESLKPTLGTSRFANCRRYPEHLATFLFLQFHQAQITLFRASLVIPPNSFMEAVQSCKLELPSRSRLLSSNSICVEAARSILKQILDVADSGFSLWIFTTAQIFLAILVLIINILKEPQKRTVRLDRELVVIASELIQDQWRRVGQNSDFIAGCQILRDTVDAAVQSHAQQYQHDKNIIHGETSRLQAVDMDVHGTAGQDFSHSSSMALHGEDAVLDPFESIPLDEIWTMMDTGSWAFEHNFLGTS